jgi:N-carbamoylputrescine amidase
MNRSYNMAVAAVQFQPELLNPVKNLNRISLFVAAAHARGARLIVFPELSNTGYCEHVDLHKLAEDRDGVTVKTLSRLSQQYGVYLAAGFAEHHSGDIYNSVAFTGPRGDVSIYRKQHLIFWEHYYFRCGSGPLIVSTELGRIGFAICADMMYHRVWNDYRAKIDLAVVSAAWPKATAKTTGGVGWILRPSDQLTSEFPTRIASRLSIPVVVSNQTGPCDVRIPMMGPSKPAEFSGRSGIYDQTGAHLTSDLEGEGVAIAEVKIPREFATCVTLSG